MLRQDRFLVGILVFTGLLVLGAVLLFFTRISPQEYRQGSSPEDVVYNYVLAVSRGDYSRAYGYLAEAEGKPGQTTFQSDLVRSGRRNGNGLRILDTQIVGDEALVTVSIVYNSSGPFDSGYSFEDTARLVQQEGDWKLTYMPGEYWFFDWYDGGIRLRP